MAPAPTKTAMNALECISARVHTRMITSQKRIASPTNRSIRVATPRSAAAGPTPGPAIPPLDHASVDGPPVPWAREGQCGADRSGCLRSRAPGLGHGRDGRSRCSSATTGSPRSARGPTSTCRGSAAGRPPSAASFDIFADGSSTWAAGPDAWPSSSSDGASTWSGSTRHPSRRGRRDFAGWGTCGATDSRTSARGPRPSTRSSCSATTSASSAARARPADALGAGPAHESRRSGLRREHHPYSGGAPGPHPRVLPAQREASRPPGQVRLRYHYGHLVGGWFDWFYVSQRDLRALLVGTGWRLDGVSDQRPDRTVRRHPHQGLMVPSTHRAHRPRCADQSSRLLRRVGGSPTEDRDRASSPIPRPGRPTRRGGPTGADRRRPAACSAARTPPPPTAGASPGPSPSRPARRARWPGRSR